MFALCLESSHARGMGHFYRMVNLADAIKSYGYKFKFIINDNNIAKKHLDLLTYEYDTVDLMDMDSDWEDKIIIKNNIQVWINDRLDTNVKHSKKIKRNNIPLVTFDDRGSGAAIADLHIAALAFDNSELLLGSRILRGVDYLILNPEISRFSRQRKSLNNLLVTLGGSDTYGVTVEVVRYLSNQDVGATVIVGPSYAHYDELNKVITPKFNIKKSVPSLIEEFSNYDLAITGGGITPFEANSSGLPCIVIANEMFEIPVGKELARMKGSTFAGYYKDLCSESFSLDLPIESMSELGMKNIKLNGCERVVQSISELIH